MSLAVQRVWVDLPKWAGCLSGATWPCGSWAARHEREGDGSEQRLLGATRGEMYANARSVLDHPRADLFLARRRRRAGWGADQLARHDSLV
jgi:hypothetical protein